MREELRILVRVLWDLVRANACAEVSTFEPYVTAEKNENFAQNILLKGAFGKIDKN